jgi:hypothetical protein
MTMFDRPLVEANMDSAYAIVAFLAAARGDRAITPAVLAELTEYLKDNIGRFVTFDRLVEYDWTRGK